MPETHTERSMLDLLRTRYTSVRRGTIADRWVRAEHVREKLGDTGARAMRVADYIAADKHPGWPYGSSLALHGHEVKVTRSDWLYQCTACGGKAHCRLHQPRATEAAAVARRAA